MLRLLPLLLLSLSAEARLILPPCPLSNGTDVGLLLVPGAGIPPEQYRELGRALQHGSGLRLWVGLVGDFLMNTPNPMQIDSKIDETLADLRRIGLPAGAPLVIAGHSLGGVFLPGHVGRRSGRYSATLLLASYLPLGTLGDFPTPVMHLSGDLDGLTRVTRIVKTFQELQALQAKAESPPAAEQLMVTRAVIVLTGQNHGQFATPPLPAAVQENDIPAEVYDHKARRTIANYIDSFLIANLEGSTFHTGALYNAYAFTDLLLRPLMQAEKMDGSAMSEAAQRHIIQALPSASDVEIENRLLDGPTEIVRAKPSIEEDDGNVTVTTVTYVRHPVNPMDISVNPVTASQLYVKMKRREAVAMALEVPEPKAEEVTCKDLNAMILKRATRLASTRALKRYKASGRTVQLLNDVQSWTGPTWVFHDLELTYGVDLQVRSYALLTATSRWLPSGIEGMQYCKLLPLARAMEWIYVDALKPRPE